MGAKREEHWFNRHYGPNRRDVFLLRLPVGWQVLGRIGGADGHEVTHFLDREDDARSMLERMLRSVPEGLGNWAMMTTGRQGEDHRPGRDG